MIIEIGTKSAHESDGAWDLASPTGSLTTTYPVSFLKQHATVPQVVVAISSIVSKDFNDLKFELKADSPTTTGFTLQISALGSGDGRSTYKSAEVSWIAISE